MKRSPFEKCWAVPGGIIKVSESTDEAAERILFEKTGLKNLYLEQLYTFGKTSRDPFGRVVSVAYFALMSHIDSNLKTTEEYGGVEWFPVDKLPALAYDHKEILSTAIKRLRSKLAYSNVAYGLLPDTFTLGDLQNVYETILKKKIDKRNFRKKIKMLEIVESAKKIRAGGKNRPAELFCFKKKQLIFTK